MPFQSLADLLLFVAGHVCDDSDQKAEWAEAVGWVPTRRKGALGMEWRISGTHLCSRFFMDSGMTTEKATRKTLVSR